MKGVLLSLVVLLVLATAVSAAVLSRPDPRVRPAYAAPQLRPELQPRAPLPDVWRYQGARCANLGRDIAFTSQLQQCRFAKRDADRNIWVCIANNRLQCVGQKCPATACGVPGTRHGGGVQRILSRRGSI